MKKNNMGFALVETVVVTAFVAGILIFLYIQFSNISSNYDESYNYNTVEGIYSLRNIRDYVLSDISVNEVIESTISNSGYIDITDCSIFSDSEYCLKLLELENIERVILLYNYFDSNIFSTFNDEFKKFINRISNTGKEKYRIIAEFDNSTYATIRYGEWYEK